jgi:hypothetical protein
VITDETTEIIRQQRVAAEITGALESAAKRLRDTDAARRSAQMEIGGLLREAKKLETGRLRLADPRYGSKVEMTAAEAITGISRPTLYKLRDNPPATTGRDLALVSNEELAKAHLGYGPGGHEDVDAEMWARYPYLGGWWGAIRYLHAEQVADCGDIDQIEERQREQGGPPGADVLSAQYRRAVERIAAGPLPVAER